MERRCLARAAQAHRGAGSREAVHNGKVPPAQRRGDRGDRIWRPPPLPRSEGRACAAQRRELWVERSHVVSDEHRRGRFDRIARQ